jgi:hypothetical protein
VWWGPGGNGAGLVVSIFREKRIGNRTNGKLKSAIGNLKLDLFLFFPFLRFRNSPLPHFGGGAVRQGDGANFEPFCSSLNCVLVYNGPERYRGSSITVITSRNVSSTGSAGNRWKYSVMDAFSL